MYDVIIVGAGPAGLTAAIYVRRAGRSALLLEAKMVGGQIVNTPEIENYPGLKKVSGFDFTQTLFEQATAFGAEIAYETVTSVEKDGDVRTVRTASGKTYQAKAVILATGAKNRHLGLAREDELLGHGISYCATCDGMFFKGKEVAVNGGGSTAVGDALFLSNYCSHVWLIHRRDGFRAASADLEELKKRNNVTMILNSTVTELIGEKSLEAVRLKNKKDGTESTLPVAGLFVAIGQEPDNGAFADVARLDGRGYIEAGEDCRTATPGVFTAGDCRTKEVRQLTTAAADGAVAALAACAAI